MVIRHLFWKIFIAFFLANVFVIGATTYTVLNMTETKRFEERQKEMLEKFAEQIIFLYEDGRLKKIERIENAGRKSSPKDDPHRRKFPPMQIFDQHGHPIFDNIPNKFKKTKPIEFGLASDNDTDYHVSSYLGPKPRFIQALQRLNLLQFIFVIIASTAVSAILSWTISKPINKLRQYSQHYKEQKKKIPLPKHLLKRGDEIGNLTRDLGAMIDEIEHNMATQKQLLHDVSHELRAPLARLQVSASIIENHNPASVQYTARINSECERISRLIQEILDYSRLDQQAYQVDNIELQPFLLDIMDDIKVQYPQRHIRLHSTLQPGTIQAYPELLHRALENIILNSCKHTPEESAIDISIEKQHNLIIRIRDFGPGVDEEELQKLFQLFYRAKNKMHTEGFGLGLGIAKRAIEKHQGTIQISNHKDGGLQTVITLPLVQID